MRAAPVIEQMKLSDKAAVLAFLLKAYPENPRQSDERFWNWHFPESRYCDPNDLPIWLAKTDDGRIAGQLASVPVEFNVGDETVPAIWILDMIVDPDFRRQGIAKSWHWHPWIFARTYSGSTLQNNTHRSCSIPRSQKILFPGNAVRELARILPASLPNFHSL